MAHPLRLLGNLALLGQKDLVVQASRHVTAAGHAAQANMRACACWRSSGTCDAGACRIRSGIYATVISKIILFSERFLLLLVSLDLPGAFRLCAINACAGTSTPSAFAVFGLSAQLNFVDASGAPTTNWLLCWARVAPTRLAFEERLCSPVCRACVRFRKARPVNRHPCGSGASSL
jgi:hypothetical protein